MGVYNRAPLAFERGRGVRLWGDDGRDYLDCVAGTAVNGLGHCHPRLVKALEEQAACITHDQDALVLDDGHSTSIVQALTSGYSADLVQALSATPQAGAGYYSPYVASVL